MFQKGWHEFAKDTKLTSGDSLVLYKITDDDSLLNVCILKGEEYNIDDNSGG